MTEDGYVKVKPTLELLDHPGIWAVGDIINWKEQKQAGKVMAHNDIVAANIISYLNGQPQKKIYKGPMAEMILITLGKVCALATFLFAIALSYLLVVRDYVPRFLVGYHARQLVQQYDQGQNTPCADG